VLALARRVAAFGVVDGASIAVPDDRWPPLRQVLEKQRLSGLAVAAERAGSLIIPLSGSEELLAHQREAMLRCLTLERCLLGLASAFEGSGVPFIVLKGPALAHGVYPDPSWRPFGDIDVLVRAADWPGALEALRRLGFERDLPEPRAGFDIRFGKAATHTGPDGLQIDLHRTLALGPFGLWIENDELFDQTTTFTLGGRSLHRLDDSASFIHACVHASLGWRPPLLLAMRDVIQTAVVGSPDAPLVSDRARRWHLGAVIEHAVTSASDLIGRELPELADLAADIPPTERERKALAAYTTTRRNRGGLALSTMLAIPGLLGKAAYARDLLLPSREFLRARRQGRSPSYIGRWTEAGRRLRGKGQI